MKESKEILAFIQGWMNCLENVPEENRTQDQKTTIWVLRELDTYIDSFTTE